LHEFHIAAKEFFYVLKISGDGTKVTRISNFIVISFSILSAKKLSAERQKVLAIVKSSENYDNLSASLCQEYD
jgi:hypothetical protein